MKHIVISLLLTVMVVGCGGSDPKKPSITVNPATAIKVKQYIPYAKNARVEPVVIRTECQLGDKLSQYIYEYSVGEGIGVMRKNAVKTNTKGKVLVVEIDEAISIRIGMGHAKHTLIKGALYNNGKRQAGFTAARRSGGGMYGAFKSSCAVLGRTVKILGSDVTTWLKNPVDGAHLGDRVK